MDYKKLFGQYRKANNHFFSNKKPTYVRPCGNLHGIGKYTFYRKDGKEEYDYFCTEEDSCRHFLKSIMNNEYYRNNYKLMNFSSLTELQIKMDLLGL